MNTFFHIFFCHHVPSVDQPCISFTLDIYFFNSLLAQLTCTPNIGSKATNKQQNGSNTYTNNNYHTQTNKTAVSQYNKCNQVPPVLSSKDRLIKEPKDFTCEEVGLKIFSILSISFNVLIIITTLFSKPTIQSERVQINTKYM